MRARLACLILAAGASLGGCAYGLDPYSGGYGGVNVGYGYGYPDYGYYNPYYNGGYGYPYYGSGYGYGYGSSPYWGWYDGFYYPGSGYYVYDQYRHSRRMSDAERRYWEWRQKGSTSGSSGKVGQIVEHWGDFNQGVTTTNSVRSQGVAPSAMMRTRSDFQRRLIDRSAGDAVSRPERAESVQPVTQRGMFRTQRSEGRGSRTRRDGDDD